MRAHANADGTEEQQEVFDPLVFIQSPTRSTTFATISAQSTTLSVKSPSLDPVSTQVRSRSPPLLPFPFDAMFNLSPTFSHSLPSSQLDAPAPPSPAVTFQLDNPPSPTKSSVASSIHDDFLITDFPTLVERSSGSRSATTPPRRLVIRIPPSAEKTRKSFKPSLPRFTEEERRIIVDVPRQPESDDEDGSDTATSDAAKIVHDP